MSYFYITSSYDDLEHHGILGQKWGVRRFQNEDGSLTSAGRKRYADDGSSDSKSSSSKTTFQERKFKRSIDKIDKDIKSFDPIRNGLKDKKGRQILTKEDVDSSIKVLQDRKAKLLVKQTAKNKKELDKIDKDIKSFDPIRNGLTDKKGRQILTKEDVDSVIKNFQDKKEGILAKQKAIDFALKYKEITYDDIIKKVQK